MIRLLPLFISCILIATTTVAQKNFKLGKPPKELLNQKQHALEPDAEAAIVFKQSRIFYQFSKNGGVKLIKEVKMRLKIYKKEGTDWGTFEIPLYASRNDEEKVNSIKGYTLNMVDGELVEEKLKKEGIFEEKMNKYFNKTVITMPNVKVGSVIDLTYKINSPYLSSIGEIIFQYGIPVDEIYARVDIPEFYVFRTFNKGFATLTYDTFKENYSNASINALENVYALEAKNVPSLKEELYTNNIDNYRTAVIFEIASIQIPGEPYRNMSVTWDDVTKNIYKLEDFGGQLKKTKYFEEELDAILGTTSDKMKKAALIFNFVKSKINWNEYYGFTTDDGVKKAFQEQKGNVAEINLMLTAMLRYAGINANPVLVSTRSHGIPLFPTRDGFNYVIAAIEIENAVILLDATDKNSLPNILPDHVLNWKGRLIRKDGSSSVINLIPTKKSSEIRNMNVKLSENGDAEGKVRVICTDHVALRYRQKIKPIDTEQYLEKLENYYNGIEISNYSVKNENDLSKPVIETYDFYAENVFEAVGDKLYISPLLFMAETENPFKSEKREFPVDFTFPKVEKYMFNIQLPEGYKIESVPENAAVKLPENLGIFRYNLKTGTNNVQLVASVEINSAVVPAKYYEVLKEYFKRIIDKESEKIVLTKA